MSFLSDGIGWFSSALRDAAGEPVTIARGTATTVGVVAVRISHDAESQKAGPSGVVVTHVIDQVWTVTKTLYLIGGTAVEPRPGDRWTDATGTTWEVMPSIAGPAVVSFCDGLEWEVKTKKVV